MSNSALPSATPANRRWPRVRAFLPGLTVVLLTLYFFQPTVAVMDPTLDNSNFASYATFTATGTQYGVDVIAPVGPYGFAHYGWIYAGHLFGPRVLLDLLIKATLAILIVWFVRLPGLLVWRVLWFLLVLLLGKLTDDLPFTLCILLAGLYLVMRFERAGRPTTHCLLAALLALLTLCKGTETVLVGATFGLIGVQAFISRRFARLGWIAAAYTAAYLLLWLVARQNPRNIPAFLHGVLEITSGYNAAFSIQEARALTVLGVTILLGLLFAAATTAWISRGNVPRLLAATLLTGFSLVAWKHGYVRADGHVFLFFHFAAVASLMTTIVLPLPTTGDRRVRRAQAGLMLIPLAAALFGLSDGGNIRYALKPLPMALPTNVAHLLHLREAKAQLDDRLEFQRSIVNLLRVRKAVGPTASVDFFGFEHGYIPLNQLRYAPRPMGGGSFSVSTPYLLRLNADYILNPKTRPDYYLLKLATIDERLLSQDDTLSLQAIIANYEPVLTEKGLFLLRARPGPTVNPKPSPLSTVDFSLGDTVPVPAVDPDKILLLSLDFQSTWLGRLRSLVYKPAHLYMDLDGLNIAQPIQRRIIPSVVSQPVILCPLLEINADFIDLYGRRTGKTVTSFRLNADPADGFRRPVRATFYTLPRPPMPTNLDSDALADGTRSTLWNSVPDSIPPSIRTYGSMQAVFLHAPGEIVFTLKGNERGLEFDYGIDPAAERQPTGDGVTYIVEIENRAHGRKEIFRRHLFPLKEASDRGLQTAKMQLPIANPGDRLLIRTDPGPAHNNAWDWSFLTHIDLQRGAYEADLFPGFNVVPLRVEAEHVGVSEIDGRKLFMLNAPGYVELPLRGHEQILEFSGGILPGAYTGAGATDGVGFIVELRHADGHAERLFYRYVRPLIVPADRGDQPFTVKLPYAERGTHLRIMIDGGPRDDISWDWSYLSSVQLR